MVEQKSRIRINIASVRGNKLLPKPKIAPVDSRIKLLINTGDDYQFIYVSSDNKIHYLKPSQMTEQVARFLDCGLAFPDEETVIIDLLSDMVDMFLPCDVEVLPVCDVEIEVSTQPLDKNALIFPGQYLHTLQSWSKRELKKDLLS